MFITTILVDEPDPFGFEYALHEARSMDQHYGAGSYIAYMKWVETEEQRGDLAFHAEQLWCYQCEAEKRVVKLGRVVEERRDPTQSYVLECGHSAI